ncbi:hypothetical protein [Dokdonella soli]|uniref:DUF202 domain-containing protein n=1 Tax=Dokdonella soli TaxID=529810 RepID=A0ABP3TN04_9GAMM
MSEDDKSKVQEPSAIDSRDRGLPNGYRQGLITAITVLLGFSLTFLRFWGFEASGAWSWRSVVATAPLVAAIALQIVALLRSLRLEDDTPAEYRRTIHWFIASAVVLLFGLLLAGIETAIW